MKDLLDVLKTMIANRDKVDDPKDLLLDVAERVARHVTQAFGAQPDEVAILLLTSNRQHLRFAAPRRFAELGTIPVTKRDSIAVGILDRKRGEVINNVRMVRHVAFFESVKLRDRVLPIQKMVTVPIVAGVEAIGVAQISRKGESPAEAGPDFTEADVRRAQEIFSAVGPLIAEARPERY